MVRTIRMRSAVLVAAMAFAVSGTLLAAPTSATSTTASQGTGPQPKGLGLGSKAALAQKTCNENGHTSFNTVGGGPFCVNPWPERKSNGGATAAGVDATTVQVIAYIPNDQMIAAGTADRAASSLATGARVSIEDALADMQKAYEYATDNLGTFQLWGRRPVFSTFVATGPDEVAQRADALAIIDKKPFMVVDMTRTTTGGAPVFAATVAGRKILTVSASTTPESGAKFSPYLWNYSADQQASIPLTSAFVGRALAGKKAQWAGDPAYQSKTRAFGLVYPTTNFDLVAFEKELKSNGGATIAQAVAYDPSDPATFGTQVPTLIQKLKASGATSVILFADNAVLGPLTKNATDQGYSPEWIITGYGYHEYPIFIRTYDQAQWAHAFGLSVLYPGTQSAPAYTNIFTWYSGAKNGNYWSIGPGLFGFTYNAIQYAGPTLTAENVKKGLFAVPAQGGAATGTTGFQSGYGNSVGMPYPEYSALGTDRALAWYDPTKVVAITGGSPFNGTGAMMYLDSGKRYTYKGLPTSEPKFFDPKVSVSDVPITATFEGGIVPAASPCTGCPSASAPAA